MGRKFLDDIGHDWDFMSHEVDAPRAKEWEQEKETFGFSSVETWNLDTTMVALLYERVKMYMEVSAVDLTYHQFEIDGVSRTQEECIEELLRLCETILGDDYDLEYDEVFEAQRKIWIIWSNIACAMWW